MHCRSRAGSQKLFAGASIGALLVAPILTTASVVLRRPNIAAPVANMTALLAPSDTERQALRTSRLEAARQKLTGYLIAHREAAKFLVAVPNANVAAPLIIQTGLPVMAIGGYLGDDPILTPSDIERLASDRQLRFVMLGGFTLAPAKQRRRSIRSRDGCAPTAAPSIRNYGACPLRAAPPTASTSAMNGSRFRRPSCSTCGARRTEPAGHSGRCAGLRSSCPGLSRASTSFRAAEAKTWMAGHRRAEATPSFRRLCPAMTAGALAGALQAVRMRHWARFAPRNDGLKHWLFGHLGYI